MSEKLKENTSENGDFSQLHEDINHLLRKNWTIELIKVGFPISRLRNGALLMREYCKGVADTLEDQERRSLVPAGFMLPKIRLDVEYDRAVESSYIFKSNALGVNKKRLIVFASFEADKILEFKSGRKSSARDYFYLSGVEEIKHAVDYKAGKAIFDTSLYDDDLLNYLSRKHEYLALGEKVLLGKKKNPHSESYASDRKQLQEVIQHRQRDNV